jgi:hypothetical protein
VNTAKEFLYSAFRLALAPFDLVLNADSDWVRYGLPAILLTGIFFAAMRVQDSELPQHHAITALAKPAVSAPFVAPRSRARDRKVEAQNPVSGAMTQSIPHPNVVARVPSSGAGARRAPVTNFTDAGLTDEQREGRRAVCEAVARVYASVKRGKHRKNRALQIAVSNYHGPGSDPDAAERAVTKAIDDYQRGAWSDEQCNFGPDLPKGTIGETLR